MICSLCPQDDRVAFVSSRCGDDDTYSIVVPCRGSDLLVHFLIQSANVLDCIGRRTKNQEGHWRWEISRDDLSPQNVTHLCCKVPFDSEASDWNLARDVTAKILLLRGTRSQEIAEQIAAEVSRSYYANVNQWGKFHEQ
jgi:hypothetical protein